LALSGIRVVDLTRILAGPFCTMLLADMGAEVVKIEDPKGGDAVRRQGVAREGLSWYFAQFNRNKKSVALDLRSVAGREALGDLIRGADVLVENFRPGVLAQMGFGPERLEQLNPRLVVGSVNGYGSTGPYAARPSFDFIAQAMSGFMSVNGVPDGPPLRSGLPMSDLVAGLYAAFGVVCALNARGRTGRGQNVESALTNGLISMMAYASANYFATGENPKRTGNDHPIASPYGLFHAKDGELAIAPSTEDIVRRLLRTLGLEAMLDDPDFATVPKRMQNRARINAAIDGRLGEQTVAHWIETLNGAGVPCGRVMNLSEVFADPQVQAQEMVLEVEHPGHGPVRMTGFPVKLSGTPCAVRLPAPELGQHTEEVLRGLGWSQERIAALAK
jgi:crotonobetainyl-CoA:carnitine CoA-transferase CaiB-like acyl-CoA transferase